MYVYIHMFVRTHRMVYFKQLKYRVLYFNYNLSKAVKHNLCLGDKLLGTFGEKKVYSRTLKSGVWTLVRKLRHQI